MKTILITGGSDGLGKALAERLTADSEYKIIILARNETALKAIAEQCNCDYAVCDVRDAKQVTKTVNDLAAKHGTLDVLLNDAGVIVNGELVDTDDQTIADVINTNTLGSIYVAKAILKHMKQRKSGLIVNVISQSGLTARPNRSIYNASKWAITGFTKSLQQEAAAYGVRVTGFYPGTIKTDLFAKAGLDMKGPALDTAQVIKAVEFLLACDNEMLVPELGIKHLEG